MARLPYLPASLMIGPGILDLLIWMRETQHDHLNERNATWPELTNQNGFSFWPEHWPEVNQGSKLGQSLHYFYWNVGRIKSGSHFLWLKIPKYSKSRLSVVGLFQGTGRLLRKKKTESSKTKNISASFESLDPTWVEFHNLEITVQLASVNAS